MKKHAWFEWDFLFSVTIIANRISLIWTILIFNIKYIQFEIFHLLVIFYTSFK